jgi:hypothetical protein
MVLLKWSQMHIQETVPYATLTEICVCMCAWMCICIYRQRDRERERERERERLIRDYKQYRWNDYGVLREEWELKSEMEY